MEPIAAEKELAALLLDGDEAAAVAWIETGNAADVQLTGRCYSIAIASGMADAALACAKAGFHLAVLDDPAAQEAVNGATGMRGLLEFLGHYRYCKAQRTYYLPVVQGAAPCEPIAALLEAGIGLSEADKSELLSLSIRMDNSDLARTLAQGGAQLQSDIREDIPAELKEVVTLQERSDAQLWVELATPQRSLKTLELIFEHTADEVCPIRGAWFSSYGRGEGFAAKMALIAQHSSSAACEDHMMTLTTLAQANQIAGLRAMASWEGLDADAIDAALEAAREAGHTQAAAILMSARAGASSLDFLEF